MQSDLLLLAGRGVRVGSSIQVLADRVGGLVYGLLRGEGRSRARSGARVLGRRGTRPSARAGRP